jgi:hypothetical protein
MKSASPASGADVISVSTRRAPDSSWLGAISAPVCTRCHNSSPAYDREEALNQLVAVTIVIGGAVVVALVSAEVAAVLIAAGGAALATGSLTTACQVHCPQLTHLAGQLAEGFVGVPGGSLGGVTNPIPTRVARVLDGDLFGAETLGPPSVERVFVTAADDIEGLSTAELAERLTLVNRDGSLRSGPFAVIEFKTPLVGLGSPILRDNLGFVGRGLTGGGAREFDMPNFRTMDLEEALWYLLND